MSTPPSPCRLAVYLSRKSKVGVILRRGPSTWAQLILWDRGQDIFTPGQWFHGRVYERRCDLSPDGKYFIYFAAKFGPRRDDDDIGEAWTAISKPPYFTALALWPNLGAWYGGGVFPSNKEVLLDVSCSLKPHPKFKTHKLKIGHVGPKSAPWEQRLLRDGWALLERGFDPRSHRRIGEREVWEKHNRKHKQTLCQEIEDVDFNREGGPYFGTYWLETGGDLIALPDVTWADWDTWDRLVLARAGCLYKAVLTQDGLQEEELFDFNPLRPETMAPPAWATRW